MADGAGQEKKSNMVLELRLLIDDELTWGELADFVAAAQRSGRNERSETVFSERGDGPNETVALVAWLDPGEAAPPST
jgi:hypothetical protein